SATWGVFNEVYEDTYQKIPEVRSQGSSGYVNITFLKDDGDWKWKMQVGERLPLIIEELQDKGVPLKDIAILVRFNKEGKQVVDFLSEHEQSGKAKAGYRYDVVSNESLFLVTSPTVRVVIAAIRYLHDKKDKIVKAELIYEYQKAIKRSTVPINELFYSISSDKYYQWLPPRFLEEQHRLLYLPFYELVEMLIDIFEANTVQGQYAYLQTFQDLVLKFSQNEKGDISSFLEWWEERGPKESIKVADDLDAIRILTIHKAKGLEYPSVIVPFCDWDIDHKQRSPILWTETDKAPFDVGHLPIKYKSELSETYYREAYEEEKIKAHLDSLNLLYVVFTRAVHNLWVFAPDNNNISKVMRTVLDDADFELNDHWDEQKKVFEYGNREFQFQDKNEVGTVSLALNAYQHFNWRSKITIRQSGENFIAVDETRTKINYGILMHKLLSKINFLEDKEKAVKALYHEEGLDEDQRKEIGALIDQLLNNENAKHWFSADWNVYNEMTILTPDNEFRPDRVITKENYAVIIDYKTGIAKSSDQQQMKSYKVLLKTMGYAKVDAYLWYLGENKVLTIL
ncbi:MAG: 3'-5' exonuclease, partial [Fulvivirga sp.]